MAKYVVEKIVLTKKQYVVDAYLPDEALELCRERAPITVEVLSDTVYDIHTINEYEYNQKWMDPDFGPDQLKDQNDWVGEIEAVEINEGQGTLVGPDKLKGPALNEIW